MDIRQAILHSLRAYGIVVMRSIYLTSIKNFDPQNESKKILIIIFINIIIILTVKTRHDELIKNGTNFEGIYRS